MHCSRTTTAGGTLLLAICLTFFPHTAMAGPVVQPVQDFSLRDYRGKQHSLSDYAERDVVVLAFLGTECPLAKLYSVRLQEIANTYAERGVTVIGISANQQDSITELAAFARIHHLEYPLLKDAGNTVADALGAKRTPEIFLLDQARIVRYHGRVDDQYVVGLQRDAVQRADLRLALDEVLAGQPVTVAETKPLGCIIGRVREVNEDSPVTYSKQIARIFQQRCVECHREGEIAPFTLTSYDDVVGWGEMIAEVIEEQRMPPWHADPKHGDFANDRSMPDAEKQLIDTWVKNGCPEGDPAELPAPLHFTQGWQLPQPPDFVVEMRDTPFVVPAEAGPEGVAYQNFKVDPHLEEDTWVRLAEVQPGNRSVVHHIIVYVEPPQGRGGSMFLAAYVPGQRIPSFPDGAAKKIPAGSKFRFQMHYTPIGSVQEDISRIGILIADPKDVTHEVHTAEVLNRRFKLEPFTDDQLVTAQSGTYPIDLTLLGLSPHMHLRGQSFKYVAKYEDGSEEVLLNVPAYDFNWQTSYVLAEPKTLPAGTRIYCEATYDNSDENLANPDPSETVTWGDQSWEEMMIGFFSVMTPVDSSKAGVRRGWDKHDLADLLKPLDKNKDDRLSREEVKGRKLIERYFDRADEDADGFLSRLELQKAVDRLRKRRVN